MFSNLKHMLALTAGKKLLNSTDSYELTTGKRVVCILAGAFIFRRGIKNITKKPILSIQEIALGGLLLYNGATGVNKLNKPTNRLSDVRMNQIQGNDPAAPVPEFI
jgi:hypothetical protein